MLEPTKKHPTEKLVTLRLRVHPSNVERIRRFATSVEAEMEGGSPPMAGGVGRVAARRHRPGKSTVLRGSRVEENLTQAPVLREDWHPSPAHQRDGAWQAAHR